MGTDNPRHGYVRRSESRGPCHRDHAFPRLITRRAIRHLRAPLQPVGEINSCERHVLQLTQVFAPEQKLETP